MWSVSAEDGQQYDAGHRNEDQAGTDPDARA
jgi:hypothetical protein